MRVITSALVRAIVLSVFVTGIASCAGQAGGPTLVAERQGVNDEVFTEAYSLIADRYIEPIPLTQLAMAGVGALQDIDSAISIANTGGKVIVRANDSVVGEFSTPSGNDATAWGDLTAAVVRTGQRASPGLRQTDPEKIYEAVFDGALSNLDRYSRYAGADEARSERADREGFGGIGIHLSVDDGITRVIAVMPDTPAAAAGVKDNDIIVSVEGEPIHGLELRDVVRKLRGVVGSLARFSVEREGVKEPLQFAVRRELIIPTSVIYRRENDIAYVRITRFNQGTARNFREFIAQAREQMGSRIAGVVLDLRDNPGGLLDQAVAVADALLRNGRIVSTRGRHRGSFQQYDAAGDDVTDGLPLIILVNRGSASASEIVAAALQDDGRAVLVGSNSYGKGVVQSVYRLPNDGELTLTWSRFHAPSGYNLQDLGVMPTICTSKLKGNAGDLLRAVREGRSDTAAVLLAWRREALPNEKTRKSLREACPAAASPSGKEDRDLEVAKALLHDRSLYSLALKQSSVPELASHD